MSNTSKSSYFKFKASDNPLILSPRERTAIIDTFRKHTLREFKINERGIAVEQYLRQRIIWIQEPKFKETHKNLRTFQKLFERKIIREHIVGFQMSIRKEYLEQIYDLADSDNFELIEQLVGVWIEWQES